MLCLSFEQESDGPRKGRLSIQIITFMLIATFIIRIDL